MRDMEHGEETGHRDLYRLARLYDEAFSSPDVARECEFMLDVCEGRGVRVEQILELAAGPAAHARWFARSAGVQACAVDLSEEMAAYAQECARQEQCLERMRYICTDMRGLDGVRGELTIDLAFCMLDSISYLITQEDFLAHLDALAHTIRPGGLYIIVASHPRDVLTQEASTLTAWEVRRGDRRICVEFGSSEDTLDPITQVRQTTVRITEWRGSELLQSCEDQSPLRHYLFQELVALIARSPFELVASYGAMRLDVPLDMSREAWRMVLVLQR